jgi:4-diphosphocytidyl-2-C-methyl-D-erythritol kinase
LRVLGKRADGFHELDSIVAFASIGDTVIMSPGKPRQVDVFGPFASAIVGENLVSRAVALAIAAEPRLEIGHIAIEKLLPVASGIGGGSADAAAAIRLIRLANPRFAATVDWSRLATDLGSDIPVCMADRACRMQGRGEHLSPIATLPPLHVVLVNPRVPVPADKTRQVFALLAAKPLPTSPAHAARLPSRPADWMAFLAAAGNDLEVAATAVVPAIREVLATLRAHDAAHLVRLSGAGPTCFALTASHADAEQLATAVEAAHPQWWVRATTLG